MRRNDVFKVYETLRIGVLYLVIGILIVSFFVPVVWGVLCAFKPPGELFTYPPTFIPRNPTLNNFTTALSDGNFGIYFRNTIFVTVVATILTLMLNVSAGYVFAKYTFRFQKLFFALILSTIMVPLEVVMVPLFTIARALGLFDNIWGLIIPAIASPTSIFLVRQYYRSVPNEFIDASRIDGASETSIFLRVMVPMAAPVIAVLCILSFMWRWNDFLWPKLILQSRENFVIQLALQYFSGETSINWSAILSMSALAMLPMVIMFLVFQKHIIGGITAGGVKG